MVNGESIIFQMQHCTLKASKEVWARSESFVVYSWNLWCFIFMLILHDFCTSKSVVQAADIRLPLGDFLILTYWTMLKLTLIRVGRFSAVVISIKRELSWNKRRAYDMSLSTHVGVGYALKHRLLNVAIIFTVSLPRYRHT